MAEQSSKDCTQLYNKAVKKAGSNSFVLSLLRAINPKKMSTTDIELCEDIIRGDL